jgi:predicted Zn-dependent protease
MDGQRILSRAESEAIATRVTSAAHGGGETEVSTESWWAGELRWARNRVSLAGDRRNVIVTVRRTVQEANGTASTNQVDDESLQATVRAAERAARFGFRRLPEFEVPRPSLPYPTTTIWSDATYDQTAPARAEAARALIDPAEAADMLSAGYLEARAESVLHVFPDRPALYAARTEAQCSMTVRDQRGTGSGWAGLSAYDLATIDAPALARRARDKCLASRNPVALEPGRYTVILEPQAVHDLVFQIISKGSVPSSPEKTTH